MKSIASPLGLAETLTTMFPEFAVELQLDGVEMTSYHEVLQSLAPVITGYLQAAPERKVEEFGELVNAMIAAGSEQGNAMSTCLLEHASQLKLRKIIRRFLSAAAREELR